MKSNLILLVGENKQVIDFNIYDILEQIEYDDNNKIIYDININNFMDVIDEGDDAKLNVTLAPSGKLICSKAHRFNPSSLGATILSSSTTSKNAYKEEAPP